MQRYIVMEEKRYPLFDEEEGKDIASDPLLEPVADMRQPVGATIVHDWIDDLDWNRLPILGPRLPNYGPFSKEEAIARIEEAEKELDDPSKWISSEKMWESLYSKYPWLR